MTFVLHSKTVNKTETPYFVFNGWLDVANKITCKQCLQHEGCVLTEGMLTHQLTAQTVLPKELGSMLASCYLVYCARHVQHQQAGCLPQSLLTS